MRTETASLNTIDSRGLTPRQPAPRGADDLRQGGAAVFRWGDGDARRAEVVTVEDEERLVLRFEDDGVVDLRLADDDAGTRVLVRESTPQWGTALELSALAAWATA